MIWPSNTSALRSMSEDITAKIVRCKVVSVGLEGTQRHGRAAGTCIPILFSGRLLDEAFKEVAVD